MILHSNMSLYAMYFKYSLIVALIIYNFLYLFSIEITNVTGAPAGIVIILFELFMVLVLLVPTDIIGMALICFFVSAFNLMEQNIKMLMLQVVISILIFVLYSLFQAIA